MLIVTVRRFWRWPVSAEDQVSSGIRRVVQVSEPDLKARGIAIDLPQVAKRIGSPREAAEHEDMSGEEGFP